MIASTVSNVLSFHEVAVEAKLEPIIFESGRSKLVPDPHSPGKPIDADFEYLTDLRGSRSTRYRRSDEISVLRDPQVQLAIHYAYSLPLRRAPQSTCPAGRRSS